MRVPSLCLCTLDPNSSGICCPTVHDAHGMAVPGERLSGMPGGDAVAHVTEGVLQHGQRKAVAPLHIGGGALRAQAAGEGLRPFVKVRANQSSFA